MAILPTRPQAKQEGHFARFALRGWRSAAFGGLIAVLVAGTTGQAFWPVLLQSVCISICCWCFIDLGRVPVAQWVHRTAPAGSPQAASNWPGWPLMWLVIAIGSVLGYTVGTSMSDLLLGRELGHGYFRGSWQQITTLLISSLVPGGVIVYWFYSRELIADKEAALQLAQRQVAENQLKLLESQLEPHMLFNTLANLRVLIGSDPARAQAMLDQLISFLRSTLSGSRSTYHPLRSEFERLQDYLALMRVRMGERLQTRFELPEALADIPVPPLLLQPLVENCIKHGLEPAVAGGRIELRAERDGQILVISIRDTGVGLASPSVEGTRFGLSQVRERLAALYGPAGSLSLAPANDAEGGTLATVCLPLGPLTTHAPCTLQP